MPAFLPKNFKASKQNIASSQSSTNKLKELATCSKEELFEKLNSSEKGLSKHEAHKHLLKFGANIISENKKANPLLVIFENIKNPLTLMLIVLASVSLYMDDVRTAVVVGGMTLLSVALSSMQEFRSSKAAEKLSSMVSSTATVLRQNDEPTSEDNVTPTNSKIHESHSQTIEIAIKGYIFLTQSVKMYYIKKFARI